VNHAETGSIVASLGLKMTSTGDTLCEPTRPVLFEPIRFAEPVLSMAVEAKSKVDQDKLDDSLAKLAMEDPTFKVGVDSQTKEVILTDSPTNSLPDASTYATAYFVSHGLLQQKQELQKIRKEIKRRKEKELENFLFHSRYHSY